MTTIETGRWLLVAVAIVGLALAATAVSAHGPDRTMDHPHNETTTDHAHNGTEAAPYGGTAEEWEGWMENHMTEHMGPGSAAWMEAHIGVTVEEMAQHMADGNGTAHDVWYPNHHRANEYGTHGPEHDDVYGTHVDDTHRDDDRWGGHGMAGRGHGC